MARSAAASGASSALGWLYFVSWSVSFYPQAVLNYRRKSVVGMSFDFQTLNLLGYSCYSMYTCCLYFDAAVRDDRRCAIEPGERHTQWRHARLGDRWIVRDSKTYTVLRNETVDYDKIFIDQGATALSVSWHSDS